MRLLDRVDIPVRFATLRFERELEAKFREYYARRNHRHAQFVILLAIAVLALFGILDRVISPDDYLGLWRVRYVYTLPVLLVTFAFSLTRYFIKYMQLAILLCAAGTGAGVVMIITVAEPPLSHYYYASLILIFMFVYCFSRLRFPLAVFVGFFVFVLYQISAIVLAPVETAILVNNDFFLMASGIVGIASCYSYEYSTRRAFYLNHLLETEKQKTEEIVAERTAQLSQANEALGRHAFYDPLTGANNRRALNIHLQELILGARREPKRNPMALLYADLDFFKDANDTYGHDVGDEILRQMAKRIQDCVRQSDYVCRLGGDEFIVFLSSITVAEDAAVVAEKLLSALSVPYEIRDYVISLSASIGIAVFPRDGESSPELVRAADKALSEAKKQRNSYMFFTETLHSRASARIRIIGKLRDALKNGEFFLLYQPIIDARGAIVAAEALIRWKSPDGGIVSPLDFVPTLEETGLIVTVGEWILKTACTDAVRWAKAGIDAQVTVNLSVKQFRDSDLEKFVANAIVDSGIRPDRLILEITESLLMEDVEQIVEKMVSVRDVGVSFSMDDFGTGYSSLSYLKDLPVGSLKIDKYFVNGLPDSTEDTALIGAVVTLAKGLGLYVVAEGVESQPQLEQLVKMGCDRIQGYVYSKPISSDELIAFAEGLPKK